MPAPKKTDRIGIVGAGPGGLAAAFFLNERGYRNVTVIEKRSQVGGKARSWWVDGTPIDLGALDVAKGYRRVRALAKVVDQPLVRTAHMGLMDRRTGVAAIDLARLTRGIGKLRLGWMILKYLFLTGIRYVNFLEQPGMQNVPPRLTVPMSDWLREQGLEDLTPIFNYICTNFGYGPLDRIPAAYLLRFIDFFDMLEVLAADLGFHSWPRNFKHGYQSLWEGVAGYLGNQAAENGTRFELILGKPITEVRRDPGNSDPVRVLVEGQSQPYVFDHVIVACGLTKNIVELVPDLDPQQAGLFGKIHTNPYSTTVCRVSGLPRVALGNVPLAPFGHTYCCIKNWDTGAGAAFYVMNPDGLSDEELFDNIRSDMALLKTLDGKPVNVEVKEIIHHENWQYFPHVPSDELAAGFYDQFESMQGDKATYYSGGLLGFETVGNTVRYSESLIQRFFPA